MSAKCGKQAGIKPAHLVGQLRCPLSPRPAVSAWWRRGEVFQSGAVHTLVVQSVKLTFSSVNMHSSECKELLELWTLSTI